MDIHENEDQLDETEPMSAEKQALDESPGSDITTPEVGEDIQSTDEVEETPETVLVDEVNPVDAEESPESDITAPEVGEEIQPTAEVEETPETVMVEEVNPAEAEETPETAIPEDEGDLQPIIEAEETPEAAVVEEESPLEMEEDLTEDSAEEGEPLAEVEEEDGMPEPEEADYPQDTLQEEAPSDPYASVTVSEESVQEPEDGRVWYVVHCYSGNEDKVRHNILQRTESMSMDDLIFDVVVPTEDEVNIKNGERQTVEKKVFPGYILVNMILTEESWYMVRNTPGVTGFVGMGNDPTPLQPEEVARILKRMESESPRINITFRPGERVRIVDGPFEDFYGKVAEIDMERATVRVMVNFFGRETPVELDFLQVEEA